MSNTWSTHDAGFFTLEIPEGWLVEQPSAGMLLVQDARGEVRMTMKAQSRGGGGGRGQATAAARSSALEAQAELQKWLGTQPGVEIRQKPRMMVGAAYSTAVNEGLQRLNMAAALPWYKRLLGKARRQNRVLWRYWAVLNPHLLVLASAHGQPAAVERHRATLDRVMQSLRLPERDILIGRRFTETVVTLARNWFPETSVTVIDDVNLQFGTQNVSLANLHRRYLSSPEDLPTQVHEFLCAVQGELPASVVVNAWASARDRILPTFLTRTAVHNHASRLAHEPWVNGLAITYVLEDEASGAGPSGKGAVRKPQGLTAKGGGAATHVKAQDSSQLLQAGERPITLEDLERWHITPEELHAQALQNLVMYSHEHTMQGQKGEGFTMLCLGGSASKAAGGGASPTVPASAADRHNAARVLLPELHRKLREHLGATFFAAIPTRDLLLAFSASDDAVLTRVREQVAADFTQAYLGLSPTLFLVTPDGIAGDPHDEEDFVL
jgi:hypothetical protein